NHRLSAGSHKATAKTHQKPGSGDFVPGPPNFPSKFSSELTSRNCDPVYAWRQIVEEPLIAVALAGLIISIAFFNFAGITVTKVLSATTRTVVDSIRTVVIWAASIPLFHAKFIPYQIIGFVLLILGMCFYNDIIFGPWYRTKFLPDINTTEEPRGCTRCCFAFWGVEKEEEDEEEQDRKSSISTIEDPQTQKTIQSTRSARSARSVHSHQSAVSITDEGLPDSRR
ncbi:unnamed protein product, partial [Cylicocyclus nassatus]